MINYQKEKTKVSKMDKAELNSHIQELENRIIVAKSQELSDREYWETILDTEGRIGIAKAVRYKKFKPYPSVGTKEFSEPDLIVENPDYQYDPPSFGKKKGS